MNLSRPSKQQVQQAIQRAWQLYQAHQPEIAERTAREILQYYPSDAETNHLLGVIALQDGQTEEAIALFSKALKIAKRHFLLHANLGLAYHEQGNLVLAEHQYQTALNINPQYADAWFNLHALKINHANLAMAKQCLSNLLKINPQDTEAQFAMGVLCEISEHEQAAAPYFKGLSDDIMATRLDAWAYLKAAQPQLAAITGSMINTFELAFKAAKVDGMILEFGVRHGNSIRQLAKFTQQPIHGFDSFEGLPEQWHAEGKGAYSTKGRLPSVPKNVFLHQGWFDEVLPAFLSQEQAPVKLLNIDCDLYSSTKTVLDLLAPRMIVGTVIVFDEYIGNAHWREDEFKAFQEAVKRYGWQYEYLAFSFFTKQVAVRITKSDSPEPNIHAGFQPVLKKIV
jgi:tetratricopeptide (TPR) repeat protein